LFARFVDVVFSALLVFSFPGQHVGSKQVAWEIREAAEELPDGTNENASVTMKNILK